MLEFSLLLNNWAFQPETWLILGILLILTDLLLGLNYFLLPLGIGAFLTALMVVFSNSLLSEEVLMERKWYESMLVFENWKDLLYWFAGFSLLCTVFMRVFFKKAHEQFDINEY